MKSVTVITPSRLHFALIDLGGNLGRIDGSIGLATSDPQVRITGRHATNLSVVGNAPCILKERAYQILERLQSHLGFQGAQMDLQQTIPLHIGLGAGTQLTLGVARAVYGLYDIPWNTREVAKLVGRGGTSGVGVVAFEQGGFVLDGGHAFPKQKRSFLPSAATSDVPPPPVLLRQSFPDWPFLLVTPHCRHISGQDEIHRFQTLCPLPSGPAEQNSHIILMKLLPALVEEDLASFADGLNLLQDIGWKRVEHEAQGSALHQAREFLLASGALGVALSSWGPTMAVFGDNLDALESAARQFCTDLPDGGTVIRTKANNTGASVQISEEKDLSENAPV